MLILCLLAILAAYAGYGFGLLPLAPDPAVAPVVIGLTAGCALRWLRQALHTPLP